METPAFLLWSLEYSCQVRGFETGRDPERIERLLRAARASSEAILEGRLFEGICVAPPHGFKLADALTIYGGRSAVETACTGCPANSTASFRPGTWAGCFGLVPLPADIERLETQLNLTLANQQSFTRTRPIWNGFWLNSPLTSKQAHDLCAILTAAGIDQFGTPFSELVLALDSAARENLAFHFLNYPPGRVEQGWWRLLPHCPRCKTVWTDQKPRACDVCGYSGPPAPDKKRRARGRRPYLSLDRLLGAAGSQAFLTRYASYQSPPAPIDLPSAPPQPAPRDNHPDH